MNQGVFTHMRRARRARQSANLGKSFEAEIEVANGVYRRRRLAHIDHNPNEWRTTSRLRWESYPPPMRALTGSGRCLVMDFSNVDFTGGGANFSVAFDCKETVKASFALHAVAAHQIARLVEKERCGVRAGLLIHFSRTGEVYWLGAGALAEVVEKAARAGAGRRPHAPKSLSPAWLQENGIPVKRSKDEFLDYLSAILPAEAQTKD